jgi:hypothetical protein
MRAFYSYEVIDGYYHSDIVPTNLRYPMVELRSLVDLNFEV